MTDNLRGAALMLGAMACFTFNDAFVKALGDELSVWQTMALRGAALTAILFFLSWRRGELAVALSARDWRLTAGRALCDGLASIFFLVALFSMPLSDLAAIMQALPLVVPLAGVIFLGERMGWRRSLAILIGFLGVMIIIRPGADGFNVFSLLALASVVCITARDLFARMLSPQAPSRLVAAVSALAMTLMGAAGLPFTEWQPVSLTAVFLLAGATLALVVGSILAVSSMRVGDIAFVSPFRYIGLVLSMLAGVIAFGERPDAWTLVGAAIVVATGLYTFWRETRVARGAT